MTKFIPNTPTVNPDKEYYIDNNVFIKRDFNISRGIHEAFICARLGNEFDYFPAFLGYKIGSNYCEIVFSLLQGETLENLKKENKLTLEDKADIQSQLLNIFNILQSKKIVHGDINESNLIFNLQTKCLYLIDFEFAQIEVSNRDLTGPHWGIIHVLKWLYA